MDVKVGNEYVNELAPSGKMHLKIIGVDAIRQRLKSGKTKTSEKVFLIENLLINRCDWKREDTYTKLRNFKMKESSFKQLLERKIIKLKE